MTYRKDFPIFNKYKDLVYLDSGATTLKPKTVIQSISNFYENDYGTVHRGVYNLSIISTKKYNEARKNVANFIKSKSDKNIIFTRGTTESINLAAFGYVKRNLSDGDEIIISEIEHHANFVPWQEVAKQKNLTLKYAEIEDDGSLDIEKFKQLITNKTKFIAITHISNALGSIMPVKEIVNIAKENNCKVLIDGAQAIAHEEINVNKLDVDFYCFSGHKMYGPTGIGICYASDAVIEKMEPISFGGDMIESVKKEGTTFTEAPLKFESGTPPISEVIGLNAAIEYIQSIGLEKIREHELNLAEITRSELKKNPLIRIIGNAKNRAATISFIMEGIHPHDIGTILDNENIAVRVGHHCTQPTMTRFKVPATARVTFGIYNEENDINRLIKGLNEAKDLFGI